MQVGSGLIVSAERLPRERFETPARGDASWSTLISGDLTPTTTMSAGVMLLEPGGVGLKPHRHPPPEIYHVLDGAGVLTIDGVEARIEPGSTAFIPGGATHSVRAAGADPLRIFYVFPVDRFSDVVYDFAE